MMLWSSDLRFVLERVNETESIWDAAKRLGVFEKPKYKRFTEKPIESMRFRSPMTARAVEESHRKNEEVDANWNQCLACWKRLTKMTFRANGHNCSACGALESVTAHHIIPRDERGPNEVWNLMPLCEACHNYVECHEDKPRTREDVIRVARTKNA